MSSSTAITAVMELARCGYIQRRENVIAVGNSGGQRGMPVGFTAAAALVHELMEVRNERRLLNLQRQVSRLGLLIIDKLGFVPLSPTGAELIFDVFSQRYERGSILVTTNLPTNSRWPLPSRDGRGHGSFQSDQ